MQRREFLKTSALALTTAGAWDNIAMGQKTPRPNLLIVHTDEHNFRTLGCYRKTLAPDQAMVWGPKAKVDTPHVDWLAERGVLCASFYATTPVCSPSRAALVSGRYPQNTPTTTNNIPLADDIITFAEILRRQGYATGYAGKWHIDGGGKPQWAPKRQFGFSDNRYMYNRGHWKKLEDTPEGPRVAARNEKGQPSYDVKDATEKNFTTDFLADKTIEFIEAHKNEPFCYMVSIPDPHGPNTVRAPYDTMFADMPFEKPRTASKPDENLPSWGQKANKIAPEAAMQKYFGMVKCIDDNLGRILDALRSSGALENTIVIFTADHGDLCGEHMRDNKGVPYEGSAKVPFVLYYPPKARAGAVIHEALGCVDFLPTILALMGVQTAGKEQGRDASELFIKGKAPADWKDITFMRGTGSPKDGDLNWLAAVTKQYKLVVAPKDAPWLFDLEKDPDEVRNFYSDPAYKTVVRGLARDLLAYGEKYNDPRVRHADIRAELKARAADI